MVDWVSAGASLLSAGGGGLFGGGSKSAERAMKDAAARSQFAQEANLASGRAQLNPFVASGTNASDQLSYLLGTGGYNVAKPTYDDAYNYYKDVMGKGFYQKGIRNTNHTMYLNLAKDKYERDLAEWQKGFDEYKNTQGGKDSQFGSLTKQFSQDDLNNDVVYNSGLQFGLDQGRNAIDARARASGSMDSGSVLKELTRFGNDYGSTKAGDAYNRNSLDKARTYDFLTGQANMGLNAIGTGIGVSSNAANNIGNSQQALASNLMASQQNRADNQNNAFQGLLGNLLYNYKNTRNPGIYEDMGYTGGSSKAPSIFYNN